MKPFRLATAAILTAAALAACAGTQSRIKKHQAEFDSYPSEIREKIRAGEVDVGFTEQQAAMAMGRPDRIYVRKTAGGQQDVWAYGVGAAPRVGIGFGIGGPGFYGGGLALAPESDGDRGERERVVLQNGVVVSVESRGK